MISQKMNYRPDIDGLRAVAVLSVIFFHISPALLPAGFIGVDIFLVISGYLISLQIFKDSDAGRFSIFEFYRRRVKRIAPAMFVVLGVTLVLAQFLLRPDDAEEVARSSFWSLLSLANMHFWLADGASYFAGPSDELPLLHYWSLAVEEQFYVIWPLVLIAVGTKLRSVGFAVTVAFVAVASFLFGEYYFWSDASFVYYMLPARAGELLVGALAAWWTHARGPLRLSAKFNQALATVGMVLIFGSLSLVSKDSPFPGFAAIPPTFGTAAVILSGGAGTTWATNFLTLRGMLWIGTISYSAYLWHWPILAFLRYGKVEISFVVGSIVFLSTLGAAWLTYQFIETPFRRSERSPLAIVGRMYAAPAAVLGLFAVLSLKTDGLMIYRFYPNYLSELGETRRVLQPAYQLDYVCQSQRISDEELRNPKCVLGPAEYPTKVVLWGDSNAAHYIGMIAQFSEAAGFRFRNVQIGSCPPLNGDIGRFVQPRRRNDCQHSNEVLFPFVTQFEAVIISASWSAYQGRSVDFLDEFEKMVDQIAFMGSRVLLIGKAPFIHGYDRLCFEKALRFPGMNCEVTPVPLAEPVISANSRLAAIAAARENVEYFDANAYLCPAGRCALRDGAGIIRYFDASHLTADASRRLGKSILEDSGVPKGFVALGQ